MTEADQKALGTYRKWLISRHPKQHKHALGVVHKHKWHNHCMYHNTRTRLHAAREALGGQGERERIRGKRQRTLVT